MHFVKAIIQLIVRVGIQYKNYFSKLANLGRPICTVMLYMFFFILLLPFELEWALS